MEVAHNPHWRITGMVASALADSDAARAHLNLAASSEALFRLDPGAEVEAGDGWLLGAGTPNHPMITNGAFRTDDGLDPAS